MTDFGIILEGFRRKLLQDILTELQDEQRAEIHPDWNTSPTSPQGQLNATFARQTALTWEVLETAYNSFDRDRAEGDALDIIGKLTGTKRRAATSSEVDCTVNLDAGTELLSGVHFAEVDGFPDRRFTPKTDYTATSSGSQTVRFKSENTGPIQANAGTLTIISTPLTGWNSITNPGDAVLGRNVDDDPTYRLRQETDITRAGSTSTKAIRTELLNIEVDGALPLQSADVLENDTDIPGINGLPPHSIECIVHDVPTIDNDVIAQTIYDNKAGGIGTNGTSSGFADLDNGQTKQVFFTRPTTRPVYLTYTISTNSGYVGDATFKAEIVKYMQALAKLGSDVLWWQAQLAGRQGGVINLDVALGFSPSPSGTADLVVGPRELATFSTANVVVVIV